MEERRDKRNIVYFIISYVINNLASGVLYDTFVNYLQEAQTSIATSFWAFYGYATFISAALLLLVPKIGYKKLLLFCSYIKILVSEQRNTVCEKTVEFSQFVDYEERQKGLS